MRREKDALTEIIRRAEEGEKKNRYTQSTTNGNRNAETESLWMKDRG